MLGKWRRLVAKAGKWLVKRLVSLFVAISGACCMFGRTGTCACMISCADPCMILGAVTRTISLFDMWR